LPATLGHYLRQCVDCVRPWFFANKADAKTTDTYLFLNKNAQKLKSVGPRFKSIMKNYFNSNASVTCVRKSMETAVSSCSVLQSDAKRNLSLAMLHDPATAQKFYVMKDSLEDSREVNQQWQQFRQALSTNSVQVDKIPAPIPQAPSSTSVCDSTQLPLLIPTYELHVPRPVALPVPMPVTLPVPSLVSATSSINNSPVREEYNEREIACSIASQLIVATTRKPSQDSSQSFQRRSGDWYCDECGYDNFSYRTSCKHCSKAKGKRKAQHDANMQPGKKQKNDIVAVLEKGTSKQNEPIYKVISTSKGVTWVREKHVPAELL
jgi:hypothetical protein